MMMNGLSLPQMRSDSPKSSSRRGSLSFSEGSVVLSSDDAEITNFVQKIGRDIKIRDKKDETVISQLLEYVSLLTNDKTNLTNLLAICRERQRDLKSEILHLKDENHKLVTEHELHAQELQEHKNDLVHVLADVASGGGVPNNRGSVSQSDNNYRMLSPPIGVSEVAFSAQNSIKATIDTLGDIFEADELSALQEQVQSNIIQTYSDAVDVTANELDKVEAELNSAKEELSKHKKELSDRKSLEDQVHKLKFELLEARDGNFNKMEDKNREIRDQQGIIDEQTTIIQYMQDDINTLESTIEELKEKLGQTSHNSEELLERLRFQLARAKSKQEQSTNDLAKKYSHVKSFSRRFTLTEASDLSLTAILNLNEAKSIDPFWDEAEHSLASLNELNEDDMQRISSHPLKKQASGAIDAPGFMWRSPSTASLYDGPNKNERDLAVLMNEKVAIYDKRIEEMESEKNELSSENSKLKNEINKLNDEIEELKDKLLPKKKRNSRKSKNHTRKTVVDEGETFPSASCVLFGTEFW